MTEVLFLYVLCLPLLSLLTVAAVWGWHRWRCLRARQRLYGYFGARRRYK